MREAHLQELQELVKEYPWLKLDGAMSFGMSSNTNFTSSLTSFSHYTAVLEQLEHDIVCEYHCYTYLTITILMSFCIHLFRFCLLISLLLLYSCD